MQNNIAGTDASFVVQAPPTVIGSPDRLTHAKAKKPSKPTRVMPAPTTHTPAQPARLHPDAPP
jgi:hypothetical protein